MLIKQNNLTIRNATVADAPQLGIWWRDGKVMAHAGFSLGLSITDAEIENELVTDTDETFRRLIIEVDLVRIGEMSYRNKGNYTAEIGIKICDFSMQGKGYGTQFIRMLMDALFGNYGYERIVLDTNLHNTRAQYVYEKIGFRKVGERNDCWKDQLGALQSAVDYEISKSEYLSNIARLWWGYVYDTYFGNDSDDVALLLDLIGSKPKSIFEVCCGTGRVLVPLAKAGHDVIGMDADEGMLARLLVKIDGLPNLKYSLANALTTAWGNNYDVVILACNTLMNIEHREDDKAAQKMFIKKAADALKSGGHFFVAYDIYPEPEKVFVGESKVSDGLFAGKADDMGVLGKIFNCGGLYNPATQIAVWNNHIELNMQNDIKHIISTHGHKYICTRDEVHSWLKDVGFVIVEEFGGYDRSQFTEESGQDIIWAQKV